MDKIVKCNIAICYWKSGNIDEAITMYEKIFEDYAIAVDEEEDTDSESVVATTQDDTE